MIIILVLLELKILLFHKLSKCLIEIWMLSRLLNANPPIAVIENGWARWPLKYLESSTKLPFVVFILRNISALNYFVDIFLKKFLFLCLFLWFFDVVFQFFLIQELRGPGLQFQWSASQFFVEMHRWEMSRLLRLVYLTKWTSKLVVPELIEGVRHGLESGSTDPKAIFFSRRANCL